MAQRRGGHKAARNGSEKRSSDGERRQRADGPCRRAVRVMRLNKGGVGCRGRQGMQTKKNGGD